MGERAEAKRRTRAALIQAGIELFSREGLDGPSLDAICEHAGYTRGAFYVHFQSRDDFLVAVMEEAGGPILDVLIQPDEDADLAAMVARFAHAFADGTYPLGPGGGIKPHQLLDACARSPRVRDKYVGLVTEAIRRAARVVARSQRAGDVRGDVDPSHVGGLFLAAIIGAQTMMELGVPFDLANTAMAVLKMLSAEA
jgi:AcrR family transcriptional regulator